LAVQVNGKLLATARVSMITLGLRCAVMRRSAQRRRPPSELIYTLRSHL